MTIGGETEVFHYMSEFFNAWQRTPGAIEWLRANAG